MWKAINGAFFLRFDWAKTLYLASLFMFLKAKGKGNVALHSFCVMDNHTHKAAALKKGPEHYSNWMRCAHSRFGLLFNRRRRRQGPVGQDRPKTVVIEDEEGLRRTMFYHDYNPVAAGIVEHPGDYRYSSYNFYAHGVVNGWTKHLTPPQWYLDLAANPEERQRKYRKMASEYWRKKLLPSEKDAEGGYTYGSQGYMRKTSRFMAAVSRHIRRRTYSRHDLARLVGRLFEGLREEAAAWGEAPTAGALSPGCGGSVCGVEPREEEHGIVSHR